MKHLKHPATIVATLALFVALAGGAYASGLISGKKIKNGTISSKKLNKAAIKQFTAPTGSLITWSATATTASPTPTPLGTFDGNSYQASCSLSSGVVQTLIYFKTSDGSWSAQYANDQADGTIYVSSRDYPAGTFIAFTPVLGVQASSGSESDDQITILQSKPSPSELTWHAMASTSGGNNMCRVSIESTPENVVALSGASPSTPSSRSTPAVTPGHSLLGRP